MNHSPETRFSLIGKLTDPENVDAWQEFVELYQPLIFRIARRRGLQHADAAEVTQEVLTRVSKAVDRWQPDPGKGSFRGWLFQITRNLTIDHLRKAGRQPLNANSEIFPALAELPDQCDSSQHEFEKEYQRQLFAWAASRVQSEFKLNTWQAFWQTAVEGKTVPDVGRDLGMSAGAIYVARSRVMKRLSDEVKKRREDSQG